MSDPAYSQSWRAVALTHDARNVLQKASSIATARGVAADQADAVDVLAALLQTRGTLAERSLRGLGVDPAAVTVPAHDGIVNLPAKQVLLYASREASGVGHHQVDSIHVLLALMYTDSPATSSALQAAGVTLYDLRRSLQVSAAPAGSFPVARGKEAALRRRPLRSLRGVVTVSPVFGGLVAVTAAAGLALWFGVLPAASGVLVLLFVVGGWVISLCIHEFGHAATAYLGGDTSVATQGYLSFNPLRYANVFMSIVLPIAFVVLGGIGLPGGAVYINHSAIRSRTWDSLVSLAGPAGTLLCGLAIAAVFTFPGHETWLNATNYGFFAALAFLGFVEFSAVILNLIPVPGLDGFGILAPWLPISARMLVYRYATFAIIGLFIALWYVPPVRDAYFQAIFRVTALANIDPNLVSVVLSQLPRL